jgi:hypothetical protein
MLISVGLVPEGTALLGGEYGDDLLKLYSEQKVEKLSDDKKLIDNT